jgi:acyl-coenzyme A synthetase/AMP-(fatty) acid ligase
MYAADHAQAHPEQPAIVMATGGEVLTYAEFEAASNRMAHLYRDLGLRRLDHVAFMMENNPRMLEAEGGAERTGLYYTCINSYLSADEAAYIVNDSEARVVVASAYLAQVANQLPAMCPNVERWLMVDTDTPQPPYEPYDEAVAKYPTEPVADEELGAAMLYSSGTTGPPKGILRPLPEVHPGTPPRRPSACAPGPRG